MNLRRIFGAAAGVTALVLGAGMAPASAQARSSATTQASASAAIPATAAPIADTAHVKNCPAGARQLTPQQSAIDTYGVRALLPPDASAAIRGEAASPLLAKLAGRHIHWLNNLACKATKANHHLSAAGHSRTTAGGTVFDSLQSTNWSGYDGESYPNGVLNPPAAVDRTDLSWTVPAVNGPDNLTLDSSSWTGMGGVDNTPLIQAGTSSHADEFAGFRINTSYYPWYEIVPQENAQQISNLTINPGDAAGADVLYDPTTKEATFTVCDFKSNTCQMVQQASNYVPGLTADYIVERGEENGSIVDLNNFGTTTLSNAYAITNAQTTAQPGGSIAGIPKTMINCDAASTVLATVGSWDSTQTSFTDTWHGYGNTCTPTTH